MWDVRIMRDGVNMAVDSSANKYTEENTGREWLWMWA